jgi:hypothetical protein
VQAAGAPVETIEEVAGAIAITPVADDLVEQSSGAVVIAGGEGAFGLLQAHGEHAFRFDRRRAGLLETETRRGVLGIEKKDAAEHVGRFPALLTSQEFSALVEQAPDPVSLDARQIA